MAPLIPLIVSNVIPLLFGKAEEAIQDKVAGTASFKKGSKGLVRSKTAGILVGAVGVKAAILALPVEMDIKLYIIAGLAILEFLAGVWVRIKTKEPV